MEDLIKQAFVHVDVIGAHVQEGHYDLMGPDGEIILPMIWDKTIQPGWQITMRMWPMEKHPLQRGRMPPGMVDPRMTPEQQQQQFLQYQMRMRQAQGPGHHGHGVRVPMRPHPEMMPPGGMPPGGMPPPPPPGFHFGPRAGGEARARTPGVHIVDAKPEKKKGDGKAAKKTMSFFAGTKKPKKSSSSKKYVHQTWY